jgi:hypothetical protein
VAQSYQAPDCGTGLITTFAGVGAGRKKMVWILGVSIYTLSAGLLGSLVGRLLAGSDPSLPVPAPWPELKISPA